MTRKLTFAQALNEATDQCLQNDRSVYIMGLGVPDPKGIFGSTLGLQQKYGPDRVMDMPVSENAMTGVAIGSALAGMRPVMTHQRIDFALLAVEQLVNQAAKWHYMFGGQSCVPLTVRMVIGRGWGQGAQHSQSLEAWFAHVPGLKVVMPATPYDAKGMLIASIEDNNPVIFLEHRWLYNAAGDVPEAMYRVPIGTAKVMREGTELTIIAASYMTLESMRAAEVLSKAGVSVEVIDIRTLRPLDENTILTSVNKTGHVLVADNSFATGGISSEVAARVADKAFRALKGPVKRIGLPDSPSPTSPGLSKYYYPRASHIVQTVEGMLGLGESPALEAFEAEEDAVPHDQPDAYFKGPF